jgi:uncharacterized protein YgbK (DUF1537 family)
MIGVIADDLTGAAELGAVGLRCGLAAEVWLDSRNLSAADLICIDSNSRSCLPQVAGRRAASAARALKRLGASWVYKKVDSAMRGSIAVELEHLMRTLGLPRTLLVPANPSKGRVIRRGRYFIQDIPLHKTDFRFDPEYPCRDSSVRKLLGDMAKSPIPVCKVGQPLPAHGIIVGQAETAADVRYWASRCDSSTLAAGAVEFFTALLERDGLKLAKASPPDPIAQPHRELFVAGSACAATCQFIEQSRADGVPVFTLPIELTTTGRLPVSTRRALAAQIKAAFGSDHRVVAAIGLPLVKNQRIARRFSVHLASLAADVLESTPIQNIFAEGGATAASLARALGWQKLHVHAELALGVVTLFDQTGNFLTVKPGTYTWPIGV